STWNPPGGRATSSSGPRWRSSSRTSCCGTGPGAAPGPSESPCRCGKALRPEQIPEMIVEKDPGGVDLAAQGRDLVEQRVAPAQLIRAQGVQLAPVRAAAGGEENRLEQAVVVGVGLAVVSVHRDVGAVAAV